MTETTLSFLDPSQILILFGARDQHLRRVRESTGVEVTIHGDEIRLKGTEDQIRHGLTAFSEMREIIEQKGHLDEADVTAVLGDVSGESSSNEEIDLLEQTRRVVPRTQGQAEYISAIRGHDVVFCAGPAGCGKTYLAVAMAVNALRQDLVRKIVLVRPAVEAGERLGFLPGDMYAKVNPYLRPLLDALNDILDFDQVTRYLEKDIIEIVPLAFMRGRTLNDTFIILDEGQNTTATQMKMFLTRMGNDSKIVVTGDITQTDLADHVPSGMADAMERLSEIDGVKMVTLTGRDIVRHPLVRKIVKAYDTESQNQRASRRRRNG